MATARSADPEAVALMAEIAERGGVQDDDNPLGNYLLELWRSRRPWMPRPESSKCSRLSLPSTANS